MEAELSLMEMKDEEITQEQKQLLCEQVVELRCFNETLLAENSMFEQFISRIDRQDLLSQAGVDCLGDEGGGHERRQTSQPNISDHLHQLTLAQKLTVARREVARTQQDHEMLKQRYERIQDNYKASLNGAELCLAEIRKAKNAFEGRLLKHMKGDRLEMKEPEKVLQYTEDKSKVTQVNKFNLRNQGLKILKKQLEQQLERKKEAGKANYEDLFQDCGEQRIVKNLDQLQVSNLKVQRVLSSHKEKLQSVTLESSELSSDLNKRKQMLVKIDEELQHVEEERLKAEALNEHLRRQMTDYQAPDINEYMRVKDKHKKLQQSIPTWERKVGIAQMALKTCTKVWNTQKATASLPYSAGARCGGHKIPVKLPGIAEHTVGHK